MLALVTLFAPLILLLSTTTGSAQQFESGVINTNHVWTLVTFEEAFASVPVVIAGPVEYNGWNPATARVRNITTTSFEIRVDEWDYLDGPHTTENISYFAIETGVHSIGGLTWEVGRVANVGHGFRTVNLAGSFAAAPVLVTQIESTNNILNGTDPTGLTNRLRNISSASFQVRILDEQAATVNPSGESVGYIAVSEGEGYLDGQPVLVARTGNVVTGTVDPANSNKVAAFNVVLPQSYNAPAILAAMQTSDSHDPAALRFDNLQASSFDLFLEEEKSADTEVEHTTEDVGLIIIGETLGVEDAKVEVGALTRDQAADTWYTVNLANTYENPVIVMGPVSSPGTDPSTLRVRNVTPTSFEYQVDEWDYKDPGAHATTTHHFIAMEAGVYDVGGNRWQAGIKTGVNHGWKTVNLADDFADAPVVLVQCATDNEADAVNARVRNVGTSSFQVVLDEEQLGSDAHAAEDVHYVAINAGASAYSANGTLYLFDSVFTGNTISDEGANSEAAILDRNGAVERGFENVPFPRTYETPPMLVAGMQTTYSADPAALRYVNPTTSSFSVRVEEEQSEDVEVDHSNEVVGYLTAATYVDADNDGLPDAWESDNGQTNPNADPDGDGMTNRDEFLGGSDPNVANLPLIHVQRDRFRGYENIGLAASFTISRSNSVAPVTVFFDLGGAPTANRPVADSSDYTVTGANGGGLNGSVTLPRNVNRARIFLTPVDDGYHEYPERITLTVLPSPDYDISGSGSEISEIADATNSPVNDKLLVGFFVPEGGAQTSASGVTTMVMNGMNTKARLSTSFSGLTSPQTNAHIHKASSGPASGPIIHDLPMTGELQNYEWTVTSAGAGVYTVERLIDSLFAQNGETKLYVNVHTDNYGMGEIWSLLGESAGSVEPPVPPQPPAIEPFDLTTPTGRTHLRRDVARFLTQATFGPTQQTSARLYNKVNAHPSDDRIAIYETWIDEQFALDQTRHLDYVLAADWQEWVLRNHFDYPSAFLKPGETLPTSPTTPAAWPVMTGPDISAFDSLDPTTWRTPDSQYPLSQTQINNRRRFDPDLGEVSHNHRRRASWTIWANAHDQLRQRMGFAWQEIMVASEDLAALRIRHAGAARYIDMLAENSDDTFREMLEDVTYSPVMGKYLSNLRNAAQYGPNGTGFPPDENYAREIMQLFSIGLVELWQDGSLKLNANNGLITQSYDNNDITELARVLTGFGLSRYAGQTTWANPLENTVFTRGDGNRYYGASYEYPMRMFGAYHDDGVKVLNSGGSNEITIDNTSIADLDDRANADIADMHDWLAFHPNTAPFISYRLIQRLVTSNPSRGYVYRVAEVFQSTGGDLKEVTKAILLDYEARSLDFTDDENYGKMKEPLVRYLQTVRALNASTELLVDGSSIAGSDMTEYGYPADQADNFLGTIDYVDENTGALISSRYNPNNNLPGSRYRYGVTDAPLVQTPWKAPTVFNWFLPDYSPDGPIAGSQLVAPEFQVTTETSVISSINYFWTLGWNSNGQGGSLLGTQNRTTTGAPYTPQVTMGHSANADHVVADFEAWEAIYNNYPGHPTDPAYDEEYKDRRLINDLDLLLTSGNLAKRYSFGSYGDPDPTDDNPRQILRRVLSDSFADTHTFYRVRTAFYLLTTSPEFIIQK